MCLNDVTQVYTYCILTDVTVNRDLMTRHVLYIVYLWMKTCALTGIQPPQPVGLYTGTRLYRNTGLVALISELVFPLLSIRYSFRYIFSPKYFKMHEVYVFCSEQGQKLERQLLFCFELDVSAPLWRRKIVTACENSIDFHLGQRGGRHSRCHLSNKTMFLLYLAS